MWRWVFQTGYIIRDSVSSSPLTNCPANNLWRKPCDHVQWMEGFTDCQSLRFSGFPLYCWRWDSAGRPAQVPWQLQCMQRRQNWLHLRHVKLCFPALIKHKPRGFTSEGKKGLPVFFMLFLLLYCCQLSAYIVIVFRPCPLSCLPEARHCKT